VSTRHPVPLALAALLVCWAAAASAQPAERAQQLDTAVETGIENATAYIAIEYDKPNSTRHYIESGTGFFVTPTCLITNYHVIAAALTAPTARTSVRVFSGTRDSRLFEGQVLKYDSRADLALVGLKGANLPAVKPLQIHPDLPGKQTQVFAFGFPLGTMLDRSANGPNVCLRRGYVSRLIDDGRSIEADLNIDKGISGGPLVDEQGVVRGVVRAMAGSDYNRNFAALAVSSPVLLRFCQGAGVAVTLRGGELLAPGVPQAAQGPEPAPRPRASLSEDVLRAYFAVGSALRLSALVPTILAREKQDYTPGLKQSSVNNADLVLANLQRIQAPSELIHRARELSRLLGQSKSRPGEVSERSVVLEQACDEWAATVETYEKLNYDLGAWLTELSLGLLDIKGGRDARACETFLQAAQAQNAIAEVLVLLKSIQTNLAALAKQDTDAVRRAIGKDADRLIGIGYLATTTSGHNSAPKSSPATPKRYNTPHNPIGYPL
jgi:hypothetical protein